MEPSEPMQSLEMQSLEMKRTKTPMTSSKSLSSQTISRPSSPILPKWSTPGSPTSTASTAVVSTASSSTSTSSGDPVSTATSKTQLPLSNSAWVDVASSSYSSTPLTSPPHSSSFSTTRISLLLELGLRVMWRNCWMIMI